MTVRGRICGEVDLKDGEDSSTGEVKVSCLEVLAALILGRVPWEVLAQNLPPRSGAPHQTSRPPVGGAGRMHVRALTRDGLASVAADRRGVAAERSVVRGPMVLTVLVIGLALACKPKSSPTQSGPSASVALPVAAPQASAVAMRSASAPALSAPASSAPALSGAPDQDSPQHQLAALFAGAPSHLGKTQVPIRQNGSFSGAVASAPLTWSGDRWDPEGVAGPAYSGDVYGNGLIFSAADEYAALHYRAESVKAGAAPRRLTPTELLQHAYPAGVGKPTWEEPVECTVGEQGALAVIWRGQGVGVAKGRGKPWKVYLVSLVVSGKQVLVAGAWAEAHPEHEAAVINGIKGIRG